MFHQFGVFANFLVYDSACEMISPASSEPIPAYSFVTY